MYWWEYHITLLTSLSGKNRSFKCGTLLISWWNIKIKMWRLCDCKHPSSCLKAETEWTHQMKSESSCGKRRGGWRWKCEWQIDGEVDSQTSGCGEKSHKHEELHNGWGRRGGREGLSRWVGVGSSFLWITSYIGSGSMLMKGMIRQQSRSQEPRASPLLRHHFCKPFSPPFKSDDRRPLSGLCKAVPAARRATHQMSAV